jgi:hypothetical protein
MAVLALAAILPVAPAQASAAAAKPAELHSIGVSAHPDAVPADPRAPRLRKLQGGAVARAMEVPTGVKPVAFETRLPASAASLDAAQRAKLATVGDRAPAATSAPPVVEFAPKPAEHWTIEPLAPGSSSRPLLKQLPSSTPDASASIAPHPAMSFGALGVIPRLEWSAGLGPEKARDVTTIGPRVAGAAVAPAPSAIELQRRAAPASAAAPAPKPAPVQTSLPRDPNAPAAATSKSTPDHESKEVRP